jgi:hypothetical protein
MQDSGSRKGGEPPAERVAEGRGKALYFFPDAEITEAELRHLLEQGTRQERSWAISHLLRYAQWGDIWAYVSRDEVREIFPELDLPPNLKSAWARMLKVEAPVG